MSHPFRVNNVAIECCARGDWIGKLGTEASGTISPGFSKKGWMCKYMRLSFWGGCLEQLGRMGRACLNPTPDDPWFSKRELPEGLIHRHLIA